MWCHLKILLAATLSVLIIIIAVASKRATKEVQFLTSIEVVDEILITTNNNSANESAFPTPHQPQIDPSHCMLILNESDEAENRSTEGHTLDKFIDCLRLWENHTEQNAEMTDRFKQYKDFGSTYLNQKLLKTDFPTFVANNDISKLPKHGRTTVGLYEELTFLLTTFNSENSNVALPFYHELLTKILDYETTPSESHQAPTNENKLVLNYLMAVTLGKISTIQFGQRSSLVTDIFAYFDFVKHSINELKSLGKLEAMNKLKQDFNSNLNKKVDEALAYIHFVILPTIEQLGIDVDFHIKDLIAEIHQLKSEGNLNFKELEETRIKLNKQLKIKKVFEVINLVGQVVSLFGPTAAVVGTIITGVSSVTEHLVLDDTKMKPVSSLKIPQGAKNVHAIRSKIKIQAAKKAAMVQKQLSQGKNLISLFPNKLNELNADIYEIEQTIQTAVPEDDSDTFIKLNKAQHDLNAALSSEITKYKNSNTVSKENL